MELAYKTYGSADFSIGQATESHNNGSLQSYVVSIKLLTGCGPSAPFAQVCAFHSQEAQEELWALADKLATRLQGKRSAWKTTRVCGEHIHLIAESLRQGIGLTVKFLKVRPFYRTTPAGFDGWLLNLDSLEHAVSLLNCMTAFGKQTELSMPAAPTDVDSLVHPFILFTSDEHCATVEKYVKNSLAYYSSPSFGPELVGEGVSQVLEKHLEFVRKYKTLHSISGARDVGVCERCSKEFNRNGFRWKTMCFHCWAHEKNKKTKQLAFNTDPCL